ncbi:MAG: hypothetical protein OJF59_002529 [Cytophagales bacterium]|jgi:hypothetical protein|nr:MAG: hypothetical protein OJF59_002529 [Cytophagales bacterium]
MVHNLKPLFVTALITTSTILFVNSLLGTCILIATLSWWVMKNVKAFRDLKEKD